jgi:GNAT superfamily N-acetyltransferase
VEASNTVTLRDGTTVRIRLADGTEREALVAGFERFSAESRFGRFFTGVPYLTERMMQGLTPDRDHHVAVGVFDPERPSDVGSADGLGVAVGRYIVSSRDPSRAEFALAVIDEYQGRGIGTVLLESLVIIAHLRGIETFTAEVLAENDAMLGILHRFGARRVGDGSATELSFELSVADSATMLESTDNYDAMRALGTQLGR